MPGKTTRLRTFPITRLAHGDHPQLSCSCSGITTNGGPRNFNGVSVGSKRLMGIHAFGLLAPLNDSRGLSVWPRFIAGVHHSSTLAASNRINTISDLVPTRIGIPHVPTPLLVSTCSSPNRFSP